MSTCVHARACADDEEKDKLRKLSVARHAPADWIVRASIVTMSQSAMTVPQIAAELGWDPRTVRLWIHRFNAEGVAGLGNRSTRLEHEPLAQASARHDLTAGEGRYRRRRAERYLARSLATATSSPHAQQQPAVR